nr:ABC transporter ATP-binding protein [Phytoactinopolyspora limicola]
MTAQSVAGVPATVQLSGVTRQYRRGRKTVDILRGIDLAIPAGSFVAIMGPSGAGKSTLLNCMSGIDLPTSGTVRVGTTVLTELTETERTLFRRDRLGFVFQSCNLLDGLTVQQNIELPVRVAGRPVDHAWLGHLCERMGIIELLPHRPQTLSGGQQQRVAIARALISRPELVVGDEPTGALDSATATRILRLLATVADDMGQTVVFVTHDPRAASFAHNVLFMADGQLVDQLTAPSAETVATRMARLGEDI